MRVTESVLASTTQTNLQKMQQRLLDLQQQVSTGVKVSTPGDDPLTAQQILDLQDQLGSGDQYVKNISTGNAFLSTEDNALGSMGDSLTRLKEIALQMSNGTYNADQRTNAMAEVQQIKQQMISLGNTKLGDRYVFSGSKTDTQPFDTSGAYNGNDSDVAINIDASNSVVINYSGGKLLRGTGGGTDVLGTIDNLINSLGSNDESGIQSTLSDLDKSMNQVLSARTDIGARMNRLDATNNFLSNTQVYLQQTISGKQDVDIAKAISDLTQQQTAYQASLMSTAKISSMSLLDYLT